MLIKGKIKNINYAEIADRLLKSGSAKQDGSAFADVLKRLFSGGISILPQRIKDAAVIKLCRQSSGNITDWLNRLLSDNEIDAKISAFTLEGGSRLMNIQITIDSINYEQIIIKFLPQIIGLIPKNENTKVFTDALDVVGDDLDSMVKALLNNLDDEKKEKLVKLFVNNYSQNISSILNKLISDNGITAEIIDFGIS